MIASTKRYMTAFAAAALIAVAVSACGGGGKGPIVNSSIYDDVDLSDLMDGFTTGAGRFTIKAGSQVDRGDVRFTCASGGADCTVRVMVDDNGMITAESLSTGGTVTARNIIIEPPSKEDVNLSGVTVGFLANAITMLEIKAGKSKNHGDITFSCAADGRDCVVMVMVAQNGTITATSTGGKVTASDASDPNTLWDQKLDPGIKSGHSMNWPFLQADGTPPASLGYVAMTDTAVAEIDGWTPSVHELETLATNADPAMTDTLVIYSNTDFLTPRDFAEVYPFDVDDNGDGDYDSLLLISSDWDNIGGGIIPTILNDKETVMDRTLDGAPGTYVCANVAGCIITINASGNVNTIVGNMHFTPDTGATVNVPDPDYMYFGYWLQESEDGDGDPTFEIAGMYWGAVPSPIYDVQQLEGSATYEGAATGLYVRRWTDTNNDVLRRRTGQFTADAVLSANFGGGDIAMNDQYSISGTISNFMANIVGRNRAIDSNWNVQLDAANFVADGGGYTTFANSTQDVDGSGSPISGAAATGDWSGYLLGEVNTVAPGESDSHPSGVAGVFDGHFNNGDVIGAFGAERQ